MVKKRANTSGKDAQKKLLIRSISIAVAAIVVIAVCVALFAGRDNGPGYTNVGNDFTQSTNTDSTDGDTTETTENKKIDVDSLPKLPVS